MHVPFSYLDRQFADIDDYLEDIRTLVHSGDLTLGAPVQEFEARFAKLSGIPYVLGVGSGTDAIILSLKMVGVEPDDEVITTPNTFVATVGAIAMTGAQPVFVDSNDYHTIDANQIEKAITPKTKAIVPVHWTGTPADMPDIMEIAKRHQLAVVEDAAQAISASIDGQHVGSWGDTACFSLHPLKNLNIWGDGGFIVTRSAQLYEKLNLFRNHGLASRDEVVMFGHNSRLDSLQAVIANRLMEQVHFITEQRIANARRYDEAFADMAEHITIPPRRSNYKQVYHLYVMEVKDRDALHTYLNQNGVRAKIHYPIPMHLQKAANFLGYQEGDFPRAEAYAKATITLPAHQHLTSKEVDYVIEQVRQFYLG